VGKTAVTVLSVKRGLKDIIGEFKEVFIITADRAGESVCYSWWMGRRHCESIS
jgi:hypothetical protein